MQKCLAPLLIALLMVGATSASAQEKSADQWQYDFEAYGWLPQINITTATGGDIKWTLSELLSNLDMMAMFDFGARKNKWSMRTDILYLNLGTTKDISGDIIGHPVSPELDLDLGAFITTVHGGYQVACTPHSDQRQTPTF